MEIKKIFVAGAGLMGGGIAQVCAQAGYEVVMRDISEHILNKSLKAVQWSVGKLVEKGKVQGSVEEILGRLKTTTDLSQAADADFVFEAIIENLEAKRGLFAELDNLCPAHTIFATNTSAIPVTEIADLVRGFAIWAIAVRSFRLHDQFLQYERHTEPDQRLWLPEC